MHSTKALRLLWLVTWMELCSIPRAAEHTAEGFGAKAAGGRGGGPIEVSNLNPQHHAARPPPVCPVPNSDAVRNHSLTSAARRNRARHLGLSFPKRYINEAPRRAKNWRSKRPCPTRLRRRWRVDPKSIFASTVDSRTSFGCHAWAWSATGLFARSPRFRNKASIALAAVKQKSLLFLLLQSN
jgi:hypothetical protein